MYALQSLPVQSNNRYRTPRGRYIARVLGALVAEFIRGAFGEVLR